MLKKVFLFPGQGSQYVGMGEKLCRRSEVASRTFDEASEILNFDLKKLCFKGELTELTKTENLQPAILTMSVASFRAFTEQFGARADYMAGHSLGEISALTCSGAIAFEDAVKIARQRGKFMQEAVAENVGAMAAIRNIDKETIELKCKEVAGDKKSVSVSNYNSRNQIVVSGYKEDVLKVTEILTDMGAQAKMLQVSAPFHCALMQPAADRLKTELEKYTFNDVRYKVLSNVTARPYEGKESIIENLVKQVVSPVQWIESMLYLRRKTVEIGIELGAGSVLKNMMTHNTPSIRVFTYDNDSDIKTLGEIDLTSKYSFFSRAMGIAVATPNKNWDNEEYQKGVVEPYRVIQKLNEKAENDNSEISIEDMKKAVDMLSIILKTKGTSEVEIKERMEQFFWDTDTMDMFCKAE